MHPLTIFLIEIQKGANASRADDTKGLKGVILDWITPPDGMLVPQLNRRHKFDRGFNHEVTGALLCPAGVDWNTAEWAPLISSPHLAIIQLQD